MRLLETAMFGKFIGVISKRLTRRSLIWLIPLFIVVLILVWPLPRSFVHPADLTAVQIVDRNGQLLYEVRPKHSGSHQFLDLKDMPPSLLDAVVAIEDRTFYEHGGVSIRGIARAVYQNISAGRIVSGGSTITQQLVRNRIQPTRRTFVYKMIEAFLAWKLDHQLSKDNILESYLNTSYFGHQAYGLNAACHTYFGKAPHELSIAESAMLAGILQSPTALDPFKNLSAAKARRTLVLNAMRETDAITKEQYNDALNEQVILTSDAVDIQAPHFVFWLLDQHPELVKAQTVIRTTIDLSLQKQIERIIEKKLKDLADKNVTSSAVVVLDAHNGDLLAMVGSADYFDTKNQGAVNVAISPRQPGSAIKPFTYALALARGDTAATTVADIETQFFTQEGNPYTPRNYDFGFHGLVRYREALANSYNISAVKVLQKVGVATLLQFLRDAGISSLNQTADYYGLALTLGDAEVSLLDLAKAYAVFPRAGRTLAVRTVESDPVVDGRSIMDPKVAWLISDILSDNSARLQEFGGDSPLAFPFPVAAKTGTTRNSRDNWTMGYTPDVVVGVWVGNANNAPMQGTSGVTGAGPIFHDVMLAATDLYQPHAFPVPPGITRTSICTLSGKLPTPECPNTMTESFIAGTEPKERDDMFHSIALDARNGLLATSTCAPQFVIHKSFALFPPETAQWARENGWAQPPTLPSPLCAGGTVTSNTTRTESTWLEISSPNKGDSFQIDPLIPMQDQQVILMANASSDISTVRWYIDGQHIADAHGPNFRASWTPKIGTYVVEAKAGELHQTISIQVTSASGD